jgi:hypothetical protein
MPILYYFFINNPFNIYLIIIQKMAKDSAIVYIGTFFFYFRFMYENRTTLNRHILQKQIPIR